MSIELRRSFLRVALAAILGASIPLYALTAFADGDDVVLLKNGGRARGSVMEDSPDTGVRIKLLDGTIRVIPPAEVQSVSYATTASPQPSSSAPPSSSVLPPPSPASAAVPPPPAPTATAENPPPPNAATAAPAIEESKARLHSGFYFRFGVGPGFIASGASKAPGQPDVGISGIGVGVELAFGGTVAPGIVIGGGIYGTGIPSPSYSATVAGTTTSASGGQAIASSIGPFIDYYFDPHQGLHLEGAIAYAVFTAGKGTDQNQYPPQDQSGNGYSFIAGIGDEWWVSPHLSLGALLRFQYAAGSVKNSDGSGTSNDVDLFIPSLLGTLTYQ